MQFTQLTDTPVPVWVTTVDAEQWNYRPPIDDIDLLKSFDLLERWPTFRAVSCDRLPAILTAGIDAEPTTDPIYVGDFEKSWEYGGWPKVIMALDPRQLERTYREIPADTPPDDIARLMQDYPTRCDSENGGSIWLTRLQDSDPRATSAYEWQYGRWVPGNPVDALIAVFVFMPEPAASSAPPTAGLSKRGVPTCRP
jgi:hypothetical protein